MLKAQGIFIAAGVNFGVHIFGSVLRGAKSESVKAQRILVVSAVVGIVFSAGVKLAENKLPVIAVLFFVIVNGYSSAEILHLNAAVEIACDNYFVAVALARFVY